MLKSPLDSWIYQEIIAETRPQVLVEIGSHSGGSTLYFAQLFDLLGEGEVLSLDIDRSRYQAHHPRITDITGDCADPAIVAQVARRCAGKRTMVIHDADHLRASVRRDLELYGPLVSPGCLSSWRTASWTSSPPATISAIWRKVRCRPSTTSWPIIRNSRWTRAGNATS